MEHALPGDDLIRQGLADLREGRESIGSLLVCIGASRLRSAGLELRDDLPIYPQYPEHRLYDLLAEEDSDSAHSRYNAYLQRLISFERAAEMIFSRKRLQ